MGKVIEFKPRVKTEPVPEPTGEPISQPELPAKTGAEVFRNVFSKQEMADIRAELDAMEMLEEGEEAE